MEKLESKIYTKEGKQTGFITLPANVFGVSWNDALMHQVVTTMQANARPLIAHAKNRGEVRDASHGNKKARDARATAQSALRYGGGEA